jgi:putative addiction module component (TIGR02574 family)
MHSALFPHTGKVEYRRIVKKERTGMSPTTEEVLHSALALPVGEQVELIEALIAALDEADPEPLDEAWMAEIRRRSAELDAGKVTPIPWSVVRERARGGDHSRG